MKSKHRYGIIAIYLDSRWIPVDERLTLSVSTACILRSEGVTMVRTVRRGWRRYVLLRSSRIREVSLSRYIARSFRDKSDQAPREETD